MGWDDAGHVDRLGPESICTEFFCVVIPVWPRPRSRYVGRTVEGERCALEIPRDARSVALGLVRTPLWLAAVILGSPAVLAPERWLGLLPYALVLAALAAWLTFGAGRLSTRERTRRSLLRSATGLGAPPELLPAELRAELAAGLVDRWDREYGMDWCAAIQRGVASPVLVAIAEYHQRAALVDRAWSNLTDLGGN